MPSAARTARTRSPARHGRLACLALVVGACSQAEDSANPPAPGFDADGSTPEAIAIADRVMTRLGGRSAWDATRYLSWRLDQRRILWDRTAGRARVALGGVTSVVDTRAATGRAWKKDGTEITSPSEAAGHVRQAHQAFVNDSYWLVMPYKLKDTGVTLKHLGTRRSTHDERCDVLELTFEQVGYTPYNRFEVYVDRTTDLVVQWNFFQRRVDTAPAFALPWRLWRRHGRILLSTSRGERSFEDVRVFDALPDAAFDGAIPFDPASPAVAEARGG